MLQSALNGKRSSIALVAIFILTALFLLRHTLSAWTAQHDLPVLPSSSNTTLISKNIAAIIEDRPLSNLIPLILHFSSVLGPDWPIILFTAEDPHLNSAPFLRAVNEGRMVLKRLPEGVRFANRDSITKFLTKPWFWEQLAPAGHVLMFQADSILCANSEMRVEDFLSYDFVGAPIHVPVEDEGAHGEGYNGGLSLRNRSMILDIVQRFSWQGELDAGQISYEGCVTKKPCLKFEDQWFYHKMKEIPGAQLPTKEVASMFAVETIWYDTPLGYHQVRRWQADRLPEIAKWCPEYAIATTDLLVKQKTPSKITKG